MNARVSLQQQQRQVICLPALARVIQPVLDSGVAGPLNGCQDEAPLHLVYATPAPVAGLLSGWEQQFGAEASDGNVAMCSLFLALMPACQASVDIRGSMHLEMTPPNLLCPFPAGPQFPKGWLAWERFRCNTDCDAAPSKCISQRLFEQMADRMVEDGFLEAGYNYVGIDDCWMVSLREVAMLTASGGSRWEEFGCSVCMPPAGQDAWSGRPRDG